MNMTKRKKKWLLLVIVILILFFLILSVFFHSQAYAVISLESQLNHAISIGDTSTFKHISQNEDTYNFLKSLSKNQKCNNTSDFQGVITGYDYYVTALNSRNIDVFLYKDQSNLFLFLYPNWHISSVRVQLKTNS